MLSLAAILSMPVLVFGIGGTLAILGGALALGVRHGIDWDHIAAITDITSTSATVPDSILTREPGLQLTDESHHAPHTHSSAASAQEVAPRMAYVAAGSSGGGVAVLDAPPTPVRFLTEQKRALVLGTLYALGHGSVVILLGLLAILAADVLPDWIDPVMERIVGATLVFLGLYLCYSLYRFFRSGEEFRIRSRWMLVFAGIGNAWHRIISRIQPHHEHRHIDSAQQYGARTALGIGMIHGIGAETGTQALIIGTAVGAGSKLMAVATLIVFVLGILISNSIVTVATASGFVSARRQQWIYVAVGIVAAVFSLVVGLVFLLHATHILPNLDPYFRWIGGPNTD